MTYPAHHLGLGKLWCAGMNFCGGFSSRPLIPSACMKSRSFPFQSPRMRRRAAGSLVPIRYTNMAHSTGDNTKKIIKVDVSSDTVCPWCFVGKKNLEKAMDIAKDQFDFEVRWHPYLLNPSAPKEGIRKSEFYKQKFGDDQSEKIMSRMREIFHGLGLEYDTTGLTGSTLDSHRLITFAAHQGYDKQNALVDELFLNYFTQGKYIGDRQVLLEAARKVGIEGAAEFLEDPSKGLKEVNEELEKYSSDVRGVPHYLINGKHVLRGGQAPEVFLKAFQVAAGDGGI